MADTLIRFNRRLTPALSRCRKRERGTSGRCKASPCKRLLGVHSAG